MANHLTPTELADEVNMKRREVISKCMQMGVPIFNGTDRQDASSSHRCGSSPGHERAAAA